MIQNSILSNNHWNGKPKTHSKTAEKRQQKTLRNIALHYLLLHVELPSQLYEDYAFIGLQLSYRIAKQEWIRNIFTPNLAAIIVPLAVLVTLLRPKSYNRPRVRILQIFFWENYFVGYI